MTIGNAWGNRVLDHMLRDRTTWVALHVADPGPDGTAATEIAGGSYARQEATWTAAASRTSANDDVIGFEDMPVCTLTHASVWAEILGEQRIIAWAEFPAAISVGLSDRVEIPAGEFVVSI